MKFCNFFMVSIITISSFLIYGQTASHANPGAPEPTVIRPKFQRVALKDRVIEALQKAKQSDHSYINDLIAHEPPDEVLSLLWPYIQDSDDAIKFALISAASAAGTSKGLEMLTTLMVTKSKRGGVNESAVGTLYFNGVIYGKYDGSRIKQWGGAKLRDNLIQFAKENPDSAEAILLLSCFKNDPQVINFLVQHRQQFGNREAQIAATGVASPTVKLWLCIDIALAETGDAKSLDHMKSYIARGAKDHLRFLLSSIKFIDNKQILSQLVELLKDKRIAFKGVLSGTPVVDLRICDIALRAFKFKLEQDKIFNLYALERFSDRELSAAYRRFRSHFNQPLKPAGETR